MTSETIGDKTVTKECPEPFYNLFMFSNYIYTAFFAQIWRGNNAETKYKHETFHRFYVSSVESTVLTRTTFTSLSDCFLSTARSQQQKEMKFNRRCQIVVCRLKKPKKSHWSSKSNRICSINILKASWARSFFYIFLQTRSDCKLLKRLGVPGHIDKRKNW